MKVSNALPPIRQALVVLEERFALLEPELPKGRLDSVRLALNEFWNYETFLTRHFREDVGYEAPEKTVLYMAQHADAIKSQVFALDVKTEDGHYHAVAAQMAAVNLAMAVNFLKGAAK